MKVAIGFAFLAWSTTALFSTANTLSVKESMVAWKVADADLKQTLARNIAGQIRDLKPGITGIYLLKCLDEMPASNMTISDAASLCAALFQ